MTSFPVRAVKATAARIVLLKGYSAQGFVFFTNYNSYKGQQLLENPKACLVFFWKELERQVRITGVVEKVNAADSDAYFLSRPLASQIGASVSPQSTVIENRAWLESKYEDAAHQQMSKPLQ
ncbi:MAG: pyridoxal 5'-phosphate synthase, partial [Sphingobacteriales bacterium]